MNPPSAALAQAPQPIRGPSVLGGAGRRFWNLTWLTAVSDYRRRYAGSALGYVWTLARPLMLFAVLYLVFTRVVRFGGQIKDYPVLLLLNIVLFQFFAESTNAAVRSMSGRGGLVRRMDVPRLVLPLSAVITAALVFASGLVVVFAWIIAYGVSPMWSWLLLPVILIPLAILTVATAMLVSALYVRWRDVAQFWPVFTRLLFYGSTVIFPIGFVPGGFLHDVETVNPLSPIFTQTRRWIIDPSAPSWGDAAGSTLLALAPLGVFVLVCVAAVVVFKRRSATIAEDL